MTPTAPEYQLTHNGQHCNNVTPGLPDFPRWGTISNIEPSRFDAGTAYISVDDHQQADYKPLIYKTEDYGKSWEKISDGIPKSMQSYVHVVREDPEKKDCSHPSPLSCQNVY